MLAIVVASSAILRKARITADLLISFLSLQLMESKALRAQFLLLTFDDLGQACGANVFLALAALLSIFTFLST